ncbi:VOC family protein [Reinekea sp.]|jgi:predicted enzyme related to lactoylglutathione lyase|uniref:VOC family protein n=1 Tax=Reinekea sp. TaxID=1970455 RepID=UPI00398A2DCF
MIKSINHVQVTIPFGAEEQARKFYSGILGLVELDKPAVLNENGGVWFKVGALQLHIGCEENDSRLSSKAHVAFNVESLDACRARFDKIGIDIFENTQIEGFLRFDIRDPFGNRIELMEKID